MQEHNHHVDQTFRAALGEHRIAVENADLLWNNISKKPKKDRAPLWIWLLAGSILVGIAVSYQFIKSAPPLDPTPDNVKSIIAAQKSEQMNHVTPIDYSKEKKTISDQTTTKKTSSKTVSTAASNNLINKKAHALTTIKNTTAATLATSQNTATTTTSINDSPTYLKNKNILSKESLTSNLTKEEKAINEAIDLKKYTSQFIDRLDINALQVLNDLPLLNKSKNTDKLVCLVEKQQGTFFGEINGSLGLPTERMSLADGMTEALNYQQTWSDRYDPLSSFSGGLMIGYQWSNGLELSAGIEYQNIESQYQSSQTVTETITVFDPMAYFYYDDQGKAVWVGDSVTAINIYDRTVNHAHTTTMINLPVHAAYPVVNKNGWQIKANVAAVFHLSSQIKGQHLREDLALIPVDDSNTDAFYRSDLSWSVEPGITILRQVSERVDAFVLPSWRISTTSYLASDSVIDAKRNIPMVKMGLRLRL